MNKVYVGVTKTYTPVEYIESSGTQWIDTGIKLPNGFKTELKTSLSQQTAYIIGVCSTNTSSYMRSYLIAYNGNYLLGLNNDNNGGSVILNADTTLEASTVSGNGYLRVNGTTTVTSSTTYTAANYNIHIFEVGGYGGTKMVGKLYYCKLYDENNTLVRDYIPVLDENNVACLYDKKTKAFYYNKGTGTFVAGNVIGEQVIVADVPAEAKKIYVGINKAYTPIEYLESNGGSYINTYFKPKSTTRFVADMEFGNPLAWGNVFGSYGMVNSNPNKFFCFTCDGSLYVRGYFNAQNHSFSMPLSGRHTIDLNKNVFTVDNESYTFSGTGSFTSNYYGLIFGVTDYNGLPATKAIQQKLYSFKIYDNGTLIRDYIPVKDIDGVPCLYELVEGEFYYNEGTGAFTAGAETGATVEFGGIACNVKKAYVGVDGVARVCFGKKTFEERLRDAANALPSGHPSKGAYLNLLNSDAWAINKGSFNLDSYKNVIVRSTRDTSVVWYMDIIPYNDDIDFECTINGDTGGYINPGSTITAAGFRFDNQNNSQSSYVRYIGTQNFSISTYNLNYQTNSNYNYAIMLVENEIRKIPLGYFVYGYNKP